MAATCRRAGRTFSPARGEVWEFTAAASGHIFALLRERRGRTPDYAVAACVLCGQEWRAPQRVVQRTRAPSTK